MKNQNDLIFSICAIVVLLIAFFATYFTKPQPVRPPQPEAVNLQPPALPQNVTPVMADSLSGNSSSGGASPMSAGPGGGPRGGLSIGIAGGGGGPKGGLSVGVAGAGGGGGGGRSSATTK